VSRCPSLVVGVLDSATPVTKKSAEGRPTQTLSKEVAGGINTDAPRKV